MIFTVIFFFRKQPNNSRSPKPISFTCSNFGSITANANAIFGNNICVLCMWICFYVYVCVCVGGVGGDEILRFLYYRTIPYRHAAGVTEPEMQGVREEVILKMTWLWIALMIFTIGEIQDSLFPIYLKIQKFA